MGECTTIALGATGADMGGNPVTVETGQELRHSDLVRRHRAAMLGFSDQLRTRNLCLPLGSLEGMPDPFALTGRVLTIDDNRPMSGRPFPE